MFGKHSVPGLIGLLIFTGCSGNFNLTKNESGPLLVPAGVDSAVAAVSDSLADQLFVSINREERAESHKAIGKRSTVQSDTLWNYLSNQLDAGLKVSQDDSIAAIHAFNAGAQNLQELAQLEQDRRAPDRFKAKIRALLEAARSNFERALVLNPFDLETKSWLARVYQSLAVRFLKEEHHQNAVKILENLLRLEKGEPSLYARLAESYYALEDWANAHRNFVAAESVMHNVRGLDFSNTSFTQEVALDTSALFYYVYYQGDTEIKMHQAQRGVKTLKRALTYATADQEKADIESYIDWISWDGGNVAAVELRDQYMALQEAGQYRRAAKGFLNLIRKLSTPKAVDEIRWRLSVLEFQFLDRKNEGIERLKLVVQSAPKDRNGAPIDSTYQPYFDSYGIMCHNLGLANSRKKRRFAYAYFQQAALINWEGRAKSYLEIAKLSRNNPKLVMESSQKALAAAEQLGQAEQMQAYQLMVEALKRMGRFEQARSYYAHWVDLRKGHTRKSRK